MVRNEIMLYDMKFGKKTITILNEGKHLVLSYVSSDHVDLCFQKHISHCMCSVCWRLLRGSSSVLQTRVLLRGTKVGFIQNIVLELLCVKGEWGSDCREVTLWTQEVRDHGIG